MSNNTNKPSDSTLISLKHLCPPSDTEMKFTETRPWITKPRHQVTDVSIRWNEQKDNYELIPSFCTPIAWHPNRTALWELMFGEPQGHVWNRFVRSFYYILPDFVKLRRRLNAIKSYLALDWLTNVAVPRVNQYDPVDYVGYCDTHLKYNPLRRPQWEDDLVRYGVITETWSTFGIRDPFKGSLYPIDDVCKWMLAQMLPVKPITKKRII